MPTLYNCLAAFSCGQVAWTEKYTMDAELALPPPSAPPPNNAANLDAVEDVFMELMNKRMPLCGEQVNLYATRISKLNEARKSRLSYWNLHGLGGQEADFSGASLVVCCQNLNNDQQKFIHMRGIWDTISVEGGRFTPVVPGWVGVWNAYTAALINGPYGWWGKLQSLVSNVTDYVQDVDGYVTIDVAEQGFFNQPVGTKLSVRLAGVNTKSELNGQLLVKVVNGQRVKTVKRISVFPYVGEGTLRYRTQQFIRFATVRPQKIGSRKPGAPLFQSAGRAPARVRS